jgi:hypothetical protein
VGKSHRSKSSCMVYRYAHASHLALLYSGICPTYCIGMYGGGGGDPLEGFVTCILGWRSGLGKWKYSTGQLRFSFQSLHKENAECRHDIIRSLILDLLRARDSSVGIGF